MSHHASYVSALDVLSSWRPGQDDPWLRHDSHLSASGALALIRALLPRLSVDPSVLSDVVLGRHTLINGDLGRRFFGIDLWDPQLEPDDVAAWPSREIAPHVVEDPPGGRHIGSRLHWRNNEALIDASILVFGNSFFGSGQSAGKLSWWFARLFKDFEFVWDPAFDVDHLRRRKPDLVVGQTIERFLGRVPEA